MGGIDSFLASGRIETEWQLVRIPVDALPARIDPGSLAVLVFETRSEGDSGAWVTAISFSRSPDSFAHAAGLRYGVDIPFWFDSPDHPWASSCSWAGDGAPSGRGIDRVRRRGRE